MADCERDGCPMEGRIARLEEWQRTSESFHTKIDTWQRDMIASTTRMETQQKAMDGKLDKLLGWQEAQQEKPGRLVDGIREKLLYAALGAFVAWLLAGMPGL